MKKTIMAVALMVALVAGLATAAGVEFRPLTVPEAAIKGATHVATVTHTNLTETTDNTAQTLALFSVVPSNKVELIYAELVTPFTWSLSNDFNTVTMTVGDGTDADRYLESMELNSNGTEIFKKQGRGPISTPTLTLLRTTLTNLTDATSTHNASADVLAVTNATVTIATVEQAKVYTAADTVDAVFTAMAAYCLDDLNAGEVRIYFRFIQ